MTFICFIYILYQKKKIVLPILLTGFSGSIFHLLRLLCFLVYVQTSLLPTLEILFDSSPFYTILNSLPLRSIFIVLRISNAQLFPFPKESFVTQTDHISSLTSVPFFFFSTLHFDTSVPFRRPDLSPPLLSKIHL